VLEPHVRTLLFTGLRPPEGYQLDFGVGTTFSLDLLTLLTAPVAFTCFDRGRDEEALPPDAVEVIESIRRYAGRLAVFCQAGRITLPRSRPPQLAFVEQSVFECQLDNGRLFHPKVWVLRFTQPDAPAIFRFLCLSRNLTFSRSWDTILQLEGSAGPRPIGENERLRSFVEALPRWATRPLPGPLADRIAALAAEVTTAAFEPPPGVDRVRFWPLGLSDRPDWPFRSLGSRTLVVSPFVTRSRLERFSSGGRRCQLVSTLKALEELDRPPEGFDRFWVLDDCAVAQLADDEDGQATPAGTDGTPGADPVELTGLHAKCYVTEDGGEAHVWTGSANATDAAFTGNVEFLVQLSGRRKDLGIDAVMGRNDDARSVPFGKTLKDEGSQVATGNADKAAGAYEERLELVRLALAKARFTAIVTPAGSDRFNVEIVPAGPEGLSLPEGVQVTCWPIMVGADRAVTLDAADGVAAAFSELTFDALTAFFAFEVSILGHPAGALPRFVLQVPLVGAPEDRPQRILRSLVRDRARLIRFLLLLLADEGIEAGVGDMTIGPEPRPDAGGEQRTASAAGLLESLVRALDRAPERIDEVAKLIEGLGSDDERQALFPPGFERIWRPIWTVRQRMTGCRTD
jgi:hypothetical protein